MMKRYKLFTILLSMSVACVLAGCGYIVLPIVQCTQTADCAPGKLCQQGQCTGTNHGSGKVGEACQQSTDCQVPLRCQQQTCQTPPSADGGPAEQTTPSESTTDPKESQSAEKPVVDGGPSVDGGSHDQPPATPDDNFEVPSPTIQSVATGGCLPGTSRACRYKQWSSDPKPCGLGQQTCQFDQSWDSCQGRKIPEPSYHPSEKEQCDDVDNDCDGYVDEGCVQSTTRCSIDYAFRYSPPTYHIAFSRTDTYAYSSQRQIALHRSANSKQLSLSRLVFPEASKEMAEARMDWLMELPPVDGYPSSFDLNRQGDLIAMSNGKKVFVWHLGYSNDGSPSVRSYAIFEIANVSMLGWGGDGRDLILYQYEYDSPNRKRTIRFFHWRADISNTNEFKLVFKTKVLPKIFGNETDNEFQKTRLSIHPNGQWLVLAHYSSLAFYRLPDFHLLKRIQLGSPVDPELRTIAFHPKRNRLVVAPFNYTKILTLDITPDAQGVPAGVEQELYSFQHVSAIQKIGFHPSTGDLYTQSYNSMFRWKDTTTGPQKPEFVAGFGSVFAMHNKSNLVAIGNGRSWIMLVHTQTGKRVASWDVTSQEGYDEYIQNMHFSPDGTSLFVSTNKAIQSWKLQADPQGSYRTKLEQTFVKDLPITPRPTVVTMQLSADGKMLAIAQNNTIDIWKKDANGTQFQNTQQTLTGHTQHITAMSFHAKYQWLVTGADDKQLRLWSLGAQPSSRVLKTYQDSIKGVSFYTDANQEEFIMVSLQNGETYVWSFQDGANPTVTELAGSLADEVYRSPKFFYQPTSSYFFTVSKTSSQEENQIVYRDIHISPKSDGASRKISHSKSRIDKPGLTIAVQYDRNRRALYGFTPHAIRVWACSYQ